MFRHFFHFNMNLKRALAPLALFLVVGISSVVFPMMAKGAPIPPAAQQSLVGYALTNTYGLISFSGPSHGVYVDASGNLLGYAWSENVGWLKFGGLSGFPTTDPTVTSSNAKIVTSGGVRYLKGWARFCSPVAGLPSCIPGENYSMNGGWTGWVSFDGSNRTISISNTETPAGSDKYPLSGYGWGADMVSINGLPEPQTVSGTPPTIYNMRPGVGWVDMSGVALVDDVVDEEEELTPKLYISASPNPTSSGDTNLTYYTDPGSSFQTCAGGLAVDNITGTSQSVAGWTGPLLTLGGSTITRTVLNVNVPYDETVFAVSCYHAATTTTVTTTILVEKLPLALTPKIDLCLYDAGVTITGGCGSGTVNVTQYYNAGTLNARLVWKSITPGVTYSSCVGVGGMASDWDGVNQNEIPGPSMTYITPIQERLMHPTQATTVYQIRCIDADTGLPVVSNTATAFRVPDVLDPQVDLKVDIAGDSIPSFSDGPLIFSTTSGGSVDLMWETQDITSPYCQVTSTQTFIDPGTGAVSTIQGAWPLHNVSSATFSTESVSISSTTTFRIDCPDSTGVSRSVSDTATVRVPGIPDPAQPAGPKKPKFIEI